MRRDRFGTAAAAACVALLLAAAPARGEEKVRIEGLFDAEVWNTDGASRYLSRNDDETAGLGRLRLWAIGQFAERVQGFALGAFTDGDATNQEEAEVDLEQAFVRFDLKTRLGLVAEAGKIATPLGNFSRRYFSDANPLVGEPSTYGVTYPVAAQLRGQAGGFDATLAMIDRPMVNQDWVPESDSRWRPALAFGYTPAVGTRLGIFATQGAYMGDRIQSELPAGSRWQEYGQRIVGFDLQFSRGYFELNGEFARSNYEVPMLTQEARGVAWFLEPKYTFSPRFFAALRYERNDYPYIAPVGMGYWIGSNADFSNIEVGGGFRIGAGATLKLSYRADRWHVEESRRWFFPEGWAVAAQLSYRFDVNSWFDRPL